jgi:gliding motility-associated-like protein
VVVNPVLNFSLDPHQLVCYNTPVTLTGPAGATSYTWTSSTGFTSNSKDVFFGSIQPKDAGTYTLTINYGPCITRDELQIEVLDHITFSLSPVDKTICLGDTIFLEGAVQGGSQNYAYVWNPPVYMDSPNGNVKRVVPQGSVFYNLIVHDIACPNFTIATTCSITVNPPSVPKLELTPGRGCAPLIMHYDTKIPAGEAIITYDFGGNEVMQKDNFDYALKTAGTYTLKVYTKNRTNGCSNLYTYPAPIVVEPRPGSDFTVTPERPTTSDRVVFNPTSSYDPIIRYSWQFEGGVNLLDTSKITAAHLDNDTSDIMHPERQYNVAGSYRTMLVTENDRGCIDTVFKLVTIIDELNLFIPNTFTPNGDGINDVFYVKGMGMKLENYSLQIIDRWGNIVFETRDINLGWDGTVRGAAARDGVYTCFVKVVGMNGEGRKEITTHLTIIK